MAKSVFLGTLFATVSLFGQEARVKMQDLPEKVQQAVRELTRTSKLRGLAKEVENGQTFYEAETVVNGKNRDVLIDEKGNVVEVEEATTLAELPSAARNALQAAAAKGKIVTVEMLKKGSEVSYEALIQSNGKKFEVVVKPDGTRVK